MTAENLNGFETIPQTLPHFCLESFRRNNKPDALSYKLENVWKHISGAEAIAQVKRIALGLSDLRVKAGDRIAIISENRPEWSLVDLACLALRAVVVPRDQVQRAARAHRDHQDRRGRCQSVVFSLTREDGDESGSETG